MATFARHGRKKRFYISKAVDESVIARWKFVGHDNAAGAALTGLGTDSQANTAADTITFRINAAAEGMNTYTGAAGGAGVITITDVNANTPREIVNIVNGVGAGMPAPGAATYNDRWRAAWGDFHPDALLVTLELLNQPAVQNALVGSQDHIGAEVRHDTSVVAAEHVWAGVGTEFALLPGGGLIIPDYFEDIPGVSAITGFASNRRDRTRTRAKQNDEAVTVQMYRAVIDYIRVELVWNTDTKIVRVYDQDDGVNPIWQQALGAGVMATDLTGRDDTFRIIGEPGHALFVQAIGTTDQITGGQLLVGGYYELALSR